jgi:hypothetical protein
MWACLAVKLPMQQPRTLLHGVKLCLAKFQAEVFTAVFVGFFFSAQPDEWTTMQSNKL